MRVMMNENNPQLKLIQLETMKRELLKQQRRIELQIKEIDLKKEAIHQAWNDAMDHYAKR